MKHALFLLLLLLPFNAIGQTAESGLLSTVAAIEGRTNLERVQVALQLLEQSGVKPILQNFDFEHQGEPRSGSNVIVRLASGNSSADKLVIGAHIDAVVFPDGSHSRGAIDNAAGSAILLHLLKALKEHNFNHPVDFVLFDHEELGLVGSRHYANNQDDDIFAMINIDIGLSGETIIFGPADFPESEPLINLSLDVCAENDAGCISFPQMPPGDDRSFRAKDIPNISLAVVPEKQAHQLWLLMNGGRESGLAESFAPEILSIIHTPNDRMELMEEESLDLLFNHLQSYIVRLDQLTLP